MTSRKTIQCPTLGIWRKVADCVQAASKFMISLGIRGGYGLSRPDAPQVRQMRIWCETKASGQSQKPGTILTMRLNQGKMPCEHMRLCAIQNDELEGNGKARTLSSLLTHDTAMGDATL